MTMKLFAAHGGAAAKGVAHVSSGPKTSLLRVVPILAAVDAHCEGRASYKVHCSEDCLSVLLTRQWTRLSGSFVVLQVLEPVDASHAAIFIRWGRTDEVGQYKLEKFNSIPEAVKNFCDAFEAATGNQWRGSLLATLSHFEFVLGKYILLSRKSSAEILGPESITECSSLKTQSAAVRNNAEQLRGPKSATATQEDATAATTKRTEEPQSISRAATKPQKPQVQVHAPKPDSPLGNKTDGDDRRLMLSPEPSSSRDAQESYTSFIATVSTEGQDSVQVSFSAAAAANNWPVEVDEKVDEREKYDLVTDSDGPWVAVLTKDGDKDGDTDEERRDAFMIIQLLQRATENSLTATITASVAVGLNAHFYCFTRWGWINSAGDHVIQEFDAFHDAAEEFERQYAEASGNAWNGSISGALQEFEPYTDKFQLRSPEEWGEILAACSGNNEELTASQEFDDLQTPRLAPLPENERAVELTRTDSSKAADAKSTTPKAATVPSDNVSPPKGSTPLKSSKPTKTAAKKEDPKATAKPGKSVKASKTDPVDQHLEAKDDYKVVWSANLAQQKPKGKFYVIQLLEKVETAEHSVFVRTGRIGSTGGSVNKTLPSLRQAKRAFEKKFEEKTKNKWLGDYDSTVKEFSAPEDDVEVFLLQAVASGKK